VKIAKKVVIFILLIIYLFLNLIMCNTYATSQVVSDNIDGIDDAKYPGFKNLINKMKEEHPNWKFEILYTNLDWNTVIKNENEHTRSLVQSTYSAGKGFVCEICNDTRYEGGSWKCASNLAIQYLMDPRYFLNEYNVFQFLDIKFNETCTKENIQKMTSGTFLNNESYINALMDSGKQYNLNPYYLVARIIQEQGTAGTTVLSSGKEYTGKSGTTYSGLYNLYNIEATGSDIIENGLKKAQKEGWTSIEASIAGGAKWIKENYSDFGQTNLYLQKFDVEDSYKGLYWHQYMQNLMAAQSEGTKLRGILSDTNAIDNEYTFLIPVYENMPNLNNMDLVKINAEPSLQLREGPSKNSNRVGLGYNGNVIIRLQKSETKDSDGYLWDLVILKNGLIGYMAREALDGNKTYLISVKDINMNFEESKPVEPEKPDIPTEPEVQPPVQDNIVVNSNQTAKLNKDTNIITATPSVTIENISELIGTINSIKDKDGNVVDISHKLGTGVVLNDMYTIVMLGDANRDGNINSGDLFYVQKFLISENKELSDIDKISMDVNKDSKVNSGDLFYIQKFLLGNTIFSI